LDHGTRVRHSLRTDNLKIAYQLQAELEHKLYAGLLHRTVDIRLDELVERYSKFIRAKTSVKNAKIPISYLLAFARKFPKLRVGETTPQLVEEYLMELKGGRASPKTWNNVRGYLHAMLEYAKKHGYVSQNVARTVDRRREPQRTIRYLRKPDIERLLSLVAGGPWEPIVATFIYAGLRRSELCWLTWNDVDFDGKILHVRQKVVGEKEWFPKTKKNRRIPISTCLLRYLTKLREFAGNGPWVFPSARGARLDADNLTHGFRKIVRSGGLSWTLLDLRHTFGSQLAMKGVGLYKIATFMGNSPQICQKHYAALEVDHLHQDIEF
jgi:integrase